MFKNDYWILLCYLYLQLEDALQKALNQSPDTTSVTTSAQIANDEGQKEQEMAATDTIQSDSKLDIDESNVAVYVP